MPAGLRIAARFNGPPGSGNGGYVAGCLAAHAGALLPGRIGDPAPESADPGAAAHCVAVRLHAPPPLERDLLIEAGPAELRLMDDTRPIATARAATIPLAVPAAPALAEAQAAAGRCSGFSEHPYPACFVCGPEREPGDGLRIFPGPHGARVAAPWRPDDSLAGSDGQVAPEFLWAALDCPGGFTFEYAAGDAVLMGEMRAVLSGAVQIGEPCVVLGWELGHSGRKHLTATALYGADGRCRGRAQATWLEV